MERILRRASRANWRKIGIITLIAIPALMVVAQFIYPFNKIMLYAAVDGHKVGGLTRDDAIKDLNDRFQSAKLDVYFGDSQKAYQASSLKDLGVSVDSAEAVDSVMYPWWLRLVPTSLWWGHFLAQNKTSKVQLDPEVVKAYATKEFGESCHVTPKDASIEVKDDTLVLRSAEDGGTCEIGDVIGHITDLKPSITEQNKVRIPMERIAPAIKDADATTLIETINSNLTDGVKVKVGDDTVSLDKKVILSWLEFASEKGKLITTVNEEKARDTLTREFKDKVAKSPGVVTITTRDFIEITRSGGGDGRALNTKGTAQNIADYLIGKSDTVEVAVTTIPPEKKYIRSYSATDTGLSALIRHYAESNKGTFGVSLIELSDQRRRAGYNESRKFTTASTYKLYVAYSTLKRIDKGEYKWTDSNIAGGRNLSKCFDDMISLSDNACAEALVKKIGYNALHKDVQSLGLSNTSFIDKESFKTTAGDLATFMASLESNQLSISKDSRSRFIAALKRNVYRSGIPAGVSGTVADKVGFLDGLLHDAAIVYAPTGTYVLTIMTDGSSWAKIADLAKQIQSLRTK